MWKKIALWGAGIPAVLAAAAFIVLPGAAERRMNKVEPHAPYRVSDAAAALHERLVIADLHADTLLWGRDPLERADFGHVDVPRLVEGNVAVQVFSAPTKVPPGLNYESNKEGDVLTTLLVVQRWPPKTWWSLTERGLHMARRMQRMEARAPERFRMIRDAGDLGAVLAARAGGSPLTGGILSFEGAHLLEGRLETIDRLWEVGFRMAGLLHFFDNELGGSLHGEAGGGLTGFGREAVRRFLERGYMIDVAHASEQVVEDVMEMTDRPLVVSHTGLRSVCDSPRNFPDALMKRIAAGGGLVGIGYWEGAVCDASPEGVVRALRAAIDVLGVDHVALGSDYDGAIKANFDTSELSVLTDRMQAGGFTETEIRAVMGGNAIRFFRENLPE